MKLEFQILKYSNAFLLVLLMLFVNSQRLPGQIPQTPNFEWAISAGGIGYETTNDIAVDNSGNIYVTGSFEDKASFSGINLSSQGSSDIFLAKYDPTGKIIWAQSAGGINYDQGNSVTIDNSGNVLITGSFQGDAVFGRTGIASNGGNDIFVAKYSANGELLWVNHGGGQSDDRCLSIATDYSDNVLITGGYSFYATFDSLSVEGYDSDIFVAKYNSQGIIQWINGIGNSDYDLGMSITSNSNNDVFVTGLFSGTVSFEGVGTYALTSNGAADIFIVKYDSYGRFNWVKQIGGENYDSGNDIVADLSGNLYLTGTFGGNVSFGNIQLTSFGYSDLFVAKFDPLGNPVWVKQKGIIGNNYNGTKITLDNSGNVSVIGGPSEGDGFIGTFDNNGNQIGDFIINGTSWGFTGGIASKSNGEIFLAGSFFNTITLGNIVLNSQGSEDIFLAKTSLLKLSLNPDSINFGTVPLGDSLTKNLIVSNKSNATLHIKSISIQDNFNGFYAKDFKIVPPLIDSIAALQSSEIRVSFTPTIAQDHIAFLILQSNAVSSPDTVKLFGNGFEIPPVIRPDSLDFEVVFLGENTIRQIQIINNNKVALHNILVNIEQGIDSKDFTILNGISQIDSIPALSIANLSIEFSPSATGNRTAYFTLLYNDVQYRVKLKGIGAIRPLTLSTNNIDFGNSNVNQSSEKSFTLTNTGKTFVIIQNALLAGPNKDEFRLINITLPDTIKPNISKNYLIRFTPTFSGLKNASLLINSNTNNSPDTIKLKGAAGIPPLSFSSKNIDFGIVDVNGSSERTVTLTNNSQANVILQSALFSGSANNDFKFINISFPDTIKSNVTRNYLIRFLPTASGNRNAFVLISSNTLNSPDTVRLKGTGRIPPLTISSHSIAFGNVYVNSSTDKSFALTNNGQANVIIQNALFSGISKDDFKLINVSFPDTVKPNISKNYLIRFTPTVSGIKNASLLISSNTLNSPDTIKLQGTAGIPPLSLSTKKIDFGNINVNSSSEKSLSLNNTGQANVIIQSALFSGTNKDEFRLINITFPDTIKPNISKNYLIRFTPTSSGIKNASLLISSNTLNSPDTIKLQGTAGIPPLSLSTKKIDFGNTNVNSTSEKSLSLTNTGRANVIIQTALFSGISKDEFKLINISFPDTVKPNISKNYLIRFTPTSSGIKNASLLISSNTLNSPDTIKLQGTAGIPPLSLSAKKIDFGNINVNSSSEKSLSLTNTGQANVIIQTALFSGISKDEFKLINISFPDTVKPNNSKNYLIRFTPIASGIKNASLLISSNTLNSPDTIKLQGSAGIPPLSLSTKKIDFGNINVNSSSEKSLSLTNTGQANVIIQTALFSGTNKDEFRLINITLPDTIKPNISKNYLIRFTPTASGIKNASLLISSNTLNSPDTIQLQGSAGIPPLNISFKTLDFGNVYLANSFDLVTTITNSTATNFFISNLVITGNDQGEFSLLNTTFPDTIHSNRSKNLTVRFAPTSTGIKNALMLITSNSVSSLDTIVLSGKGISLIDVHTSTVKLGQGATVTINPPSIYEFNNNHLYYRKTGESIYKVTDAIRSGDGYVANIPAEYSTIRGIQYYIIFSDGENTITFPEVDPVNKPATIRITVPQYSFPLSIGKSIYQMISIPLSIANPAVDSILTDDYGPYDNTAWRIFSWQQSSNSYLEYPELDKNFEPGNAFWLITRDGKTFNIGNASSVQPEVSHSINLKSGWNQIGNPFAFTVAWDSIQNSNLVQSPIFWNPEIEDYEINQVVIKPWTGYWIYNPSEDINLSVPPIESSGLGKKNIWNIPSDGFVIQISAKNSKSQDNQNFIGMLNNAEKERDRLNILEPPSILEKLKFTIESADKEYAQSIVPISKEGAYWDLKISSNIADKNVWLHLEKISALPADFKLWFLDKNKLMSIPIVEDGLQIQLPENGKGFYRLIVGKEEFAKQNSEQISLVPLEYSLSQNYPNPFNPTTNIIYQLREKSLVTLEVYDILGRKIKDLIENEFQNPGTHNTIWNGTNSNGTSVSSGIYIYRIRANNFTDSKPMILLK